MTNNQKFEKPDNYTFLQSFRFALQGVWFALKTERNLRIHTLITAYLIYFSKRYYSFSKGEIAVLVLAVGSVIVSELFNTAIEKSIDLITPDYNTLAKHAKDVAAGAVLIASIASFIVGITLFWDKAILLRILSDILKRYYIWILLIALSLGIIIIPKRSDQ